MTAVRTKKKIRVMQVNATNHLTPTPEPNRRSHSPAPAGDAAAFSQRAAIERQLENLPAARTAAIERARALVKDDSYPPDETIQRIANLLAVKVTPTLD